MKRNAYKSFCIEIFDKKPDAKDEGKKNLTFIGWVRTNSKELAFEVAEKFKSELLHCVVFEEYKRRHRRRVLTS